MTTFIISYDLVKKTTVHDYEPLWAELKRLNAHKILESVWLINLNLTEAKSAHDHLKRFVHANDRLWVSELVANLYGTNLLGTANDWLAKNPPAR